ncbi:MAG: glycosyltransferase [Bacteroidota bacterium]
MDIADYFVCQSEFVKKQIAAVHQKPIFKTTLSVYDCYNFGTYDKASARRFLNIPEGDRVILFFGLIRRYKGLDKLIRAFPMIKNGDDNYSLLIVGECYEKISYYEDIIREEGIEDKTTLINQFIDNEKIEPYFKAADMVCLPYNSASQSGILMIAYGFNIPVVVNDVGGLSELVVEGKTGTVIPNNSPAAIAKGVAKVYEYGETENFEENIGNLNQHLGYSNVEEMMGKMLETEDVTQMNNKR